ncbi:MAG: ABC transporter ATP-binding protein [Chlamydiales bacterium]|nr:ABC transporter ATP-binding protein [Chlamydiales bacterium]
MPLLEVRDLRVSFHTHAGTVEAVRGVSFDLNAGEVVGIVGESGCGKSVTAHTILGLINQPPGAIESGQVLFKGENLLAKTERQMQDIRGNQIGIIFQDPMTSLNPTMRIGQQLLEGIYRHQKVSRGEGKKIALELLEAVGIPEPERRFNQYPHEFSGGMRQRVMIAIALACSPSLIIADEPTTALDVTIQAQILELMKKLKDDRGMSILLITHDLGVVAGICDRIVVMYAGEVMESGTVEQIFYNPQHPYTKALLEAVPRLGQSHKQKLIPIEGAPPHLLYPPKGCPFTARCKWAMQVCPDHRPPLEEVSPGQKAACWLHEPRAQDRLKQFQSEEVVVPR